MKAEKAAALLEVLGSNSVAIGEEWVRGTCIFAQWGGHKGGVDRTPSFGIKIEDTSKSHFNCFGCKRHGDLDTMLIELLHLMKHEPMPGVDLRAAMKMVENGENEEAYYDHTVDSGKKKPEFMPWPEWYLEAWPSALKVKAAQDYLIGRGMTTEHIEHFDVRYDQFRQRVCFPYRSSEGELAGMRGRDIEVKALSSKKPHHDYKFNGHSNIGITWFNEHRCDTNLPVIAVEGQIDTWSVWRVYPNVVGNLSSQSSPFKLDRLQYFPEVIFMYDADKPGIEAADKSWSYLRKKVPTYCVEYSKEQYANEVDPGKLSEDELRVLLAGYVTLR